MTFDDLDSNIKMASLDLWKVQLTDDGYTITDARGQVCTVILGPPTLTKNPVAFSHIPDYFTDLNAVNRVEEKVKDLYRYANILCAEIKKEVGQCRGLQPAIIAGPSYRVKAILEYHKQLRKHQSVFGPLNEADPDCWHEQDGTCHTGIKCKLCNGWFVSEPDL